MKKHQLTNRTKTRKSVVRVAYKEKNGIMYQAKAEDFFNSKFAKKYEGKVQLIFTSPPFPLNRKKKYGNLKADEFKNWLAEFAPKFRSLLKRNGSIVIEMGNAWEQGKPIMSTLALESLLRLQQDGNFRLCQQFVAYNPARLPGPAEWVNVQRIRVKDAYTHLWWMAPTQRPKADNRRVLKEYSESMQDLLRTKKYNAGKRPSEHHIGKKSFVKNNEGAIPPNVLIFANTSSSDEYQNFCRKKKLQPHPARMPAGIPEFFVKFLTQPGDLVLDPFAGSNTTGVVAQNLERRWVAVEPQKEYVSGSRGRFAASARAKNGGSVASNGNSKKRIRMGIK